MAVQDYIETVQEEANIDISNTKRKYQTSNIITQDPDKEGLLKFLQQNSPPPTPPRTQSPTPTGESATPSPNTSTGNYS